MHDTVGTRRGQERETWEEWKFAPEWPTFRFVFMAHISYIIYICWSSAPAFGLHKAGSWRSGVATILGVGDRTVQLLLRLSPASGIREIFIHFMHIHSGLSFVLWHRKGGIRNASNFDRWPAWLEPHTDLRDLKNMRELKTKILRETKELKHKKSDENLDDSQYYKLNTEHVHFNITLSRRM